MNTFMICLDFCFGFYLVLGQSVRVARVLRGELVSEAGHILKNEYRLKKKLKNKKHVSCFKELIADFQIGPALHACFQYRV